ncbi:MAG: glycosyltransferase family 1 protein [Bacteroidaceae bacterium]|nr:glycosyltransferase family 1 protein [Bacteroidaceae bacterium]
MKILLIGEYSNVHNTLAKGLRELGHTVCVASDGDGWKNYPRDIDLEREHIGRWGFLRNLVKALPQMKGFDVVQIINPMFLELKAERLYPIYDWLRHHNGKMVMGAFGLDHYWAKVNSELMPMRYSDFNLGNEVRTDGVSRLYLNEWIGTPKEKLNRHIALDCDGIVAGLYEYWATYNEVGETGRDGVRIKDKIKFIPYPIVMPEHSDTSFSGGPVKVFIGISRDRSAYKGTDVMLRAAQDLQAAHPGLMELHIAEGVPFNEYRHMIDRCDVLLDQLYGYSPAMNSLLAMSKGVVAVGGGEPESYSMVDESELRPIINVEPSYENVYRELERLIQHPEIISQLKCQSVEYVRRHHEYTKVAKQYHDYYRSLF